MAARITVKELETNQESLWNYYRTRRCSRTSASLLVKQETRCKASKTRAALTVARSLNRRVWLIQPLQPVESTLALEVKTLTDSGTIKRGSSASLMTHIQKDKVLQLHKHMFQANPASLKHLLKRKKRARKKLKQNQIQTQNLTIQTLKTQMKKRRRREEQRRKRNLPRKLYPSQLQHQR